MINQEIKTPALWAGVEISTVLLTHNTPEPVMVTIPSSKAATVENPDGPVCADPLMCRRLSF
jgi:hypothetical protein